MTDYTSINSTVTFQPGLTNITVTINTTDDKLVEPREEFDAILSVSDHDAGRVTVLNGLSTIAITDNDLSVRILPSFSSVAESVGWVELQVVATAGSTTVPLSVLLVTHQDTAHGR